MNETEILERSNGYFINKYRHKEIDINKNEIVKRTDGYWIVDKRGILDGPFIDLEDAVEASSWPCNVARPV